jgi:copper transport protein
VKRALLLVCVAALVVPAAASAHASLEHEIPPFGSRVAISPHWLTLEFDQAVQVFGNGVRVLDVRGVNYAGHARIDGRNIVVPVKRLPRGGYTVRWRALSLDGHVVSGVYTFGVRVPAPNVLTGAVGAGGPTTTEHIVRWLWFLAIALLVGGMGFRLLVVRGPLPTRAERRFYWVVGIGAAGVLEVAIVAFLFRCEDVLQLPFGDFLYGDLSPIADGTRFGRAFVVMELGFALVAGLVYLAWLTDRPVLLWPAFLLGLGFASGLSLSGHSYADKGSSWVSELADWLHLSAASLWVGGLVQLAIVVWPVAPELRKRAILAFSRLATVCVAVLIAAGTYLSILRLPRFSDLWTTGYGHVLLVKLSLVAVALAWGGVHQFFVLPRLGDHVGSRLVRSLLGESAVAIAVLLAAAVLVDSKPPPQPAAPPPVAASHR